MYAVKGGEMQQPPLPHAPPLPHLIAVAVAVADVVAVAAAVAVAVYIFTHTHTLQFGNLRPKKRKQNAQNCMDKIKIKSEKDKKHAKYI